MAPRQRFERRLIAPSFNQHHRTCVGANGQRVCCRGDSWSTATARRPFDGCQVESLLVVHLPSLAAHTHLTTTTAAAHILCAVIGRSPLVHSSAASPGQESAYVRSEDAGQ